MIAFDLGTKITGVAWDTGSTAITCPAKLRRSPITPERRQARIAWWRDTFTLTLNDHPGEPVYAEAPFMSRQHPTGAMSLIELHGVLALVCHDLGVGCVPVTNGEIKKWATGKGNAKKPDMEAAARARGRDVADDNEADAFLLHCMITESITLTDNQETPHER